ncbi:MAG: crossover junction endodeoxyribonuclease RuvC [Gammaproteobacteria bacterium]
MTRILGIDPGSRITGFGIIDISGTTISYIGSGCVRIPDGTLPERLKVIFDGICEIVATYQPAEMVVEQVFMHRNADTALKLGQARGAAICAGVTQSLPVHEYTPAQIKQAIVGKGNATKEQIQHMVKVLLKLSATPQADAADALAAALCHCHMRQVLKQIGGIRVLRRGRVR